MPQFTTKRYDQILTSFIAKVVSRTALSDISDSSVVKHILAAVARGIDELYFNASLLKDLFSIDRATGDDLDARAAEILPGTITRNPATKSTGNVQFSRAGSTGEVTIPIGTKIQTAGGIVFSTTTTGTILDGNQDSNLVAAIADIAGEDGNVSSSTVVKFVSKPAGVDSVTNPTAFAFGTDQESDDAFRARLKQFVAGLARSTVDALESGVLGVQDPDTGQTILYAKAIEDIIDRGQVTLYIDDGTGSAESTTTTEGTDLSATLTWNGTTTVTASPDASELSEGDFIGLKSDGQLFEIDTIVTNTITILNPGSLTIPTGATTSFVNPEVVTEGLGGGNGDAAVGGETDLYLNNKPVKDATDHDIVSSTRGILVEGTDYVYNPADAHIVFLSSLSADEYIFAMYTYYTGLIALGQLIVDGDPTDRETYPGIRAAGVQVIVLTPTVVNQAVEVYVTVLEGYDDDTVKSNVEEAILDYINTLGISGDVLRAELIWKIMSVEGVYNITLTNPATDVAILDDQIARTTAGSVDVV